MDVNLYSELYEKWITLKGDLDNVLVRLRNHSREPQLDIESRRTIARFCYRTGWLSTAINYVEPHPQDDYEEAYVRIYSHVAEVREHISNCMSFITGQD